MRKGTLTRFLLVLFLSLKITKCISTHFYTFLQNCLHSEHIAHWHSFHVKPGFQQHFLHTPSQAAIVTTWIFVKVSQLFNTLQTNAHSKFLFPSPWGKLKRTLCHDGFLNKDSKKLVNPNIRINILHTFLRTFSMISSKRWRRSWISDIIGSQTLVNELSRFGSPYLVIMYAATFLRES